MEKLLKSFDYCGFNVKLFEDNDGYVYFIIYEYNEANILDGEIYNSQDDNNGCFDDLDAEYVAKDYIEEHFIN